MRAGGPHVASVVHRQGLLAPALGAIERIAVAAFIVRQVMGVRAAVPRSWWRGIQTLPGCTRRAQSSLPWELLIGLAVASRDALTSTQFEAGLAQFAAQV